jgi:hypothetical protein
MLLTGSGAELCGLLPALFQAVAYHLPAVSPLPFQSLFTERSHGDQLLALPPLSGALTAPCPLCCLFLFSSLFIVQMFFVVLGSVCPGGPRWFIPGVVVGMLCYTWSSPVGLPNVSQAGLELVSGGTASLLFSQCNMAWRSFVWAGSSRCRSFDSSWCFISAKCGSMSQQDFWFMEITLPAL